MNSIQSLRLIYEIYFKRGLPNLELIQSYGLLAVKIGQIHALRLDFLPAEKCEHLSRLYRKNKAIPEEDMEILIKNHSIKNFRGLFLKIENEPLATASVGQVYKAWLKDNRGVVIKIIKKDFKDRFKKDVSRLRKFFKLVLFIYPKLKSVGNPLGILNDIEEYTMKELDLKNEIIGQEVLKNIYEKYKSSFDLSTLFFNKIYTEYSEENIMVSEYVQSKTVDELLSQNQFEYKDMLKLFYIQGFYIFKTGKFHGDIHPGNILYDGQRFCFVDNAFIGEVGERIRRGLFFFFENLSKYEYEKCAYYLNEMANTKIEGIIFENFKNKFLELYKDFKGKTVSEVSLTKQMMLTIKLGVNSGMIFEKGIFSIIRSLMYLDGMVLKCNPKAILMEDMRKFVEMYKKDI